MKKLVSTRVSGYSMAEPLPPDLWEYLAKINEIVDWINRQEANQPKK